MPEPVPLADIEVPEELGRLRDIAYNLWWSWTPHARALFASIHDSLWAHYRNPVQLLINIEPSHWKNLLESGGPFMSLYRRVVRDFDRYMAEQKTWFRARNPEYQGGPAAYFCAEYGFHESLGIYSGGLGVLAGDHAKAASDLGLPMVGIGLLYRLGYFRQLVDPDGRQHHIYNQFDFYRLPVKPLHDATGRELHVSVNFPGREVMARVWQLTVGRVQMYLLDTDVAANSAEDRAITSQLYVRGREMRLCQELVLGIGGVRVLRALKIEPSVWHMNEGHSAFLVVERLRELIRSGMSWRKACEAVRASTAFTIHTPVPAGNEAFDFGLVAKYMSWYAESMGVGLKSILDLGHSYPGGGEQLFNLTAMALRFSSFSNAVSKAHGEVSNQMWRHLEPLAGGAKPKIEVVTNGIHTETWLGHEIRSLVETRLGVDWQDRLCDEEYWQGLRKVEDAELWEAHLSQKERMIRLARHLLVEQYARHGHSPDEIREVAGMLNSRALIIGFARRFVSYKRADLIFRDFKRLQQIVSRADRPVHLIFSGKAHPADQSGQELIRRIVEISNESDLKRNVFFIEDYDMRIARHMVQGADVWLNTPRPPREASGTSGMKAAINGCVNLSIADGWWREGYNGRNGWMIVNGKEFDNPDMQDYADAEALWHLLENEVIPLYFNERKNDMPVGWVRMMKESMVSIITAFSARRMAMQYAANAYLPAIDRAAAA